MRGRAIGGFVQGIKARPDGGLGRPTLSKPPPGSSALQLCALTLTAANAGRRERVRVSDSGMHAYQKRGGYPVPACGPLPGLATDPTRLTFQPSFISVASLCSDTGPVTSTTMSLRAVGATARAARRHHRGELTAGSPRRGPLPAGCSEGCCAARLGAALAAALGAAGGVGIGGVVGRPCGQGCASSRVTARRPGLAQPPPRLAALNPRRGVLRRRRGCRVALTCRSCSHAGTGQARARPGGSRRRAA